VNDKVRVEFFTFDPFPLFYINVDMPPNSPIENTLAQTERIEQRLITLLSDEEVRAATVVTGVKFTDAEAHSRTVSEIVDSLRDEAAAIPGDFEISFFELTGGPPVAKDINVKVRSDNFEELRAATEAIKEIVRNIDGSENVQDNDVPGRLELTLDLDERAVRQAGMNPGSVARLLRLHMDGEIVAFTRDEGEKIELRVRGPRRILATGWHDDFSCPHRHEDCPE
jgi:multidrug efflux pump subunit AcrB